MMVLARSVFSAVVLIALGAGACTTYRDELVRGQKAFERNEHDRTLAILRDLEPDVKRLRPPEQAQYAYLRGMSDYRIGYKADARHWLAVAKACEESSPGVLSADWKARTTEALDELNKIVYAQGPSGLVTGRADVEEDAKAASAPSDPAVGAKDSPSKDSPSREVDDASDAGAKSDKGPAKKTAPSKTK